MNKTKLMAERDWMLHVENMAVVRQCRRQIKEEFGEKLNLRREDLLEKIQEYAERSNSAQLRRLARPIMHHLLEQEAKGHSGAGVMDLSSIPVLGSNVAKHTGWSS